MRGGRLVAVLVFGTAAFAGRATATPQLTVDASLHDFGSVERGTPVEYVFRLRNTGTDVLHIEHVKGSCGCTVAVISERDVAPGASAAISVRLDTSRIYGRTAKTVTAYTDDPAAPAAALTLTGEVLSDLVVAPTPLYLGKLERGASVRRELRVTSARSGSDYTVTAIDHANPSLRATLEPAADGAGQRVLVELDPNLPLGHVSDQLVLHTTSPREPTITVPVFGTVQGRVLVLPPQVTFGITRGADTPPREVYIRSRGGRPLNVQRVSVPKQVVTYELATVKDGTEYRLTLRLREGLPAGKVEGSVDIFTDDPDDDHLVVPLYAIVRDGGPRS
jgi:hypothetical protein